MGENVFLISGLGDELIFRVVVFKIIFIAPQKSVILFFKSYRHFLCLFQNLSMVTAIFGLYERGINSKMVDLSE